MRMRSFEHVMKAVQERPNKRVAIVKPEEEIVLRAAEDAHGLKIADSTLIGDSGEIKRLAGTMGVDLDPFTLVHEPDATQAARKAVSMVSGGEADFLMKGIADTATVLRAVLDKEIGLRTGRILSHVAVLEIPGWDRLFFITDCGMIIDPTKEQRIEIVRNAVEVARGLGVENPKVALLAAIEKVNPDMPVTLVEREISDGESFEGAEVQGPLALDAAISPHSAKIKRLAGPVAGQADVLVVPDLQAGNIFIKGLIYFAKAKWAGIVAGARVPIIMTSRGDVDPAIRFRSIAVASLLSTDSAG
jgi:phosphate butyryltransferase